MATLSYSDALFHAVLVVASVSVVHIVARPVIPDTRPLNCAFCMALWGACGLAAHVWTIEAAAAIPLAGFFAAVAAGQWPWAFYSTPVEALQLASPEPPGKV